jgi:hypothetical protein
MGLDMGYTLMGGSLCLDVSYNTNSGNTGIDDAEDMMSLGATYNVNESMSVTLNQTTAGENGFDLDGTNQAAKWDGGNMGYLSADDQDRNVGMTYSMGAFNLGAAMHQITNTGDDAATEDAVAHEDYSRDVMEVSLGYTLNDNANLSVKYAFDYGLMFKVTHMYLSASSSFCVSEAYFTDKLALSFKV